MSIAEIPITSSATLLVLLYGALKTTTPFLEAALISTWFTPIQKHPMACNFFAAAKTFGVICVFDRIPIK